MKKIFALMTAGALALSLSACQASSQQTTDTTTKSADSTDTAAARSCLVFNDNIDSHYFRKSLCKIAGTNVGSAAG